MGLDLYVWGGGYERDGEDEMMTGLEHAARWSYGGFADFRERLAAEVGINLGEMDGFGGGGQWKGLGGATALIPLLHHSDCDGELTPDECRLVAPALRGVTAKWPKGDYDREQAWLLAEAMDRVAEHGDTWRIAFL